MLCRHCGAETVQRLVTRTLPCAGLLFELRSPVFVCDAHPGLGRVVHDDEQLEVARQIWTILADLPPSGPALIVLFKPLGLSIDERAAMFGVSRENVREWMRGNEPVPATVWDRVVELVRAVVAREEQAHRDEIHVRLLP